MSGSGDAILLLLNTLFQTVVKVRIEDWVNGNYVVLDCPQLVMLSNEPVKCRLLKTSVEVEVRQSLLERLFGVKPTVTLTREPGFYDYFYDGTELVIKGVISIERGIVTVKPDIVFKDYIEYRDYRAFIRDLYGRVDKILNNAVSLLSERALVGVDVARTIIEAFTGLTATVQELSRHNVSIVNLVNTALSGANVSIDTLVNAVNEIYQKYRWVLTPPPPQQLVRTAQATPATPAPQAPQQTQAQSGQSGGA